MKLTITTKQSVVVDQIDLDEYGNLEKPLLKNCFVDDLLEIIKRGRKIEAAEEK